MNDYSEMGGYDEEYLKSELGFEMIPKEKKEQFLKAVKESFPNANKIELDKFMVPYKFKNKIDGKKQTYKEAMPYEIFIRVNILTDQVVFGNLVALKKMYPQAVVKNMTLETPIHLNTKKTQLRVDVMIWRNFI